MELKQNKVFERPAAGSYLGTIIDVVDMPNVQSVYNGQVRLVNKIRVQWVLSHVNGSPYLDREGQPMTVTAFYTASVSEKSNLTKAIQQIINGPVPLLQTTEQLEQLIIGRSNLLFLTQEPDKRNPGQVFVSVAAIAPLPPGVVPPQAPAGFVRYKNRPKQQSVAAGAQAATTFTPTSTNTVKAVNAVNLDESF